jgi:hypothetical protein
MFKANMTAVTKRLRELSARKVQLLSVRFFAQLIVSLCTFIADTAARYFKQAKVSFVFL